MRCDEVQSLHGPYLDSELDARTSLEIEQHLKACPECARLFAEEQKVEARLKAGLNLGTRTPALWEQIERSVVAAAPAAAHSVPPSRVSAPAGRQALLAALAELLQAGLRRAPWAWAALAMAWGVIIALDLTAREPDTRLEVEQTAPSVSEMRFAWKQKQLLMADLAFISEPAPADKSKPAPPRPQSHRQTDNLDT